MIIISTYKPFVNIWEKSILIIRNNLREIERNGKIVDLRTFMKWISEKQ